MIISIFFFNQNLNMNKQIGVLCSAPGKVLLTGAYLVLEEIYSGAVVAVDARIYTQIRPFCVGNEKIDVLCDVGRLIFIMSLLKLSLNNSPQSHNIC
jgi:hypothetical protein